MKPRMPTAEEKRQWRESNRFTERKESSGESHHEDTTVAAQVPSPIGGGLGRGPEEAETVPNPGPLLTSPLQGEGRASGAASAKTPAPLKPLTQREANRLRKSHPVIEATLDLHGLTKLDAHAQVAAFIARQSRAGKRHVIIITGKGRDGVGVLRTHVPHWLNEAPLRPLISALAYASPEKGGAGVLHVLLKRRHG